MGKSPPQSMNYYYWGCPIMLEIGDIVKLNPRIYPILSKRVGLVARVLENHEYVYVLWSDGNCSYPCVFDLEKLNENRFSD